MHISTRKLCLIGIFVFLLTLALPAMAQNRIIQGKVTDDKGKAVAGAMVSIQAMDSKTRHYDVKTDKKGTYLYMGIAAGDYRVVVRAKGFEPNYVQGVRPMIQEPTNVNIQLVPGEDHKLPFEMTDEELEKIQKEEEKAEQRKKFSAEVQALFDAGLKLADEGKYQEAIAEYKKALELDPEQYSIMGNMAESYSKLDKNEEALEIYRKAIAIKPDAALYTNMGVILGKLGKSAESQEAFRKAAELNPAAAAQNFYNIGATMVNNGRTQEAIEAFKQAIAADANFAEAYYQLGMCLMGKEDTMPEAVKMLQKYIQIGKKPDQVQTAKEIIKTIQHP